MENLILKTKASDHAMSGEGTSPEGPWKMVPPLLGAIQNWDEGLH